MDIIHQSLIITRISPQRKAGRVSVFVNDRFVLGAREADVQDLGWREGMEISADGLRRAQEELEHREARAAAEYFLGFKARSEQEVSERLKSKGYSPEAIADALQHLQRHGYINDQQFAAGYAEAAGRRHIGRSRVRAELRQKGLDADTIQEASSVIDDNMEIESALEFARRRAASMRNLDRVVRERRLTAALQRRGFSYTTLRSVMERILEEKEEGG